MKMSNLGGGGGVMQHSEGSCMWILAMYPLPYGGHTQKVSGLAVYPLPYCGHTQNLCGFGLPVT